MVSENSKLASIIPLIIALGVMLSPESLIIVGNAIGSAGALFLVFLMLAMVAHFLTVHSYNEMFALESGRPTEVSLVKQALGSIPAAVLPLSSKVMFVICASTGILATAGYVFNEVFVYWFPNLGFSFCLLGVVLVINLLGRKVATTAQIVFVSAAFLGLTFLSLAGYLKLSSAPEVTRAVNPLSASFTRVAFIGLFLFVGHELAILARKDREKKWRFALPLVSGIGLLGVVFAAWSLVSLEYVSPARLADTTIPHMIAARSILGQNGRIVMGIVVMAGTLGAVNGLLFAVSRMLSHLAHEGFLPFFLGGKPERPAGGLIVLSAGIAAMMGLGMAGEPVLEVYTRASLLFWLLSYAAVHLAVIMMRKKYRGQRSQIVSSQSVSIIGFLGMITGFAGLLWTDPESGQVMKFMITMFVILSILSFTWRALKRKQKSSIAMSI
jgi:amino acid transporter